MDNLFSTGIRPAVDEFLLARAKEKRDYGLYWSASSAGYCMRKNIFERLGVPHIEREDDGRKQRVFQSGHIFHHFIQGITKEAGLSIASEVELQDEDLMVRGHFDDLVLIKRTVVKLDGELHENNDLILYDYKTAHSKSFTYAKDRPMSYYHKMQLGTYTYMLRQLQTEEVKPAWLDNLPLVSDARVLQISKDDLRMAEKQLLWDTQLESEVLDYWNSLNTHWEAKTLPKCSCEAHEGGFLAKEKYNPYFYVGQPCSLAWLKKTKEAGLWSR